MFYYYGRSLTVVLYMSVTQYSSCDFLCAAKYIEFTRLFVRLRVTLLRHLGSLHTNQMQVDREFTGHSWGWIAECLWQFSGQIVANWDSSLWWVLSWVNCGLYLLLLCQHHHWSIIILRAYMLDRHQFIDASCISKGPSWRGWIIKWQF